MIPDCRSKSPVGVQLPSVVFPAPLTATLRRDDRSSPTKILFLGLQNTLLDMKAIKGEGRKRNFSEPLRSFSQQYLTR